MKINRLHALPFLLALSTNAVTFPKFSSSPFRLPHSTTNYNYNWSSQLERHNSFRSNINPSSLPTAFYNGLETTKNIDSSSLLYAGGVLGNNINSAGVGFYGKAFPHSIFYRKNLPLFPTQPVPMARYSPLYYSMVKNLLNPGYNTGSSLSNRISDDNKPASRSGDPKQPTSPKSHDLSLVPTNTSFSPIAPNKRQPQPLIDPVIRVVKTANGCNILFNDPDSPVSILLIKEFLQQLQNRFPNSIVKSYSFARNGGSYLAISCTLDPRNSRHAIRKPSATKSKNSNTGVRPALQLFNPPTQQTPNPQRPTSPIINDSDSPDATAGGKTLKDLSVIIAALGLFSLIVIKDKKAAYHPAKAKVRSAKNR